MNYRFEKPIAAEIGSQKFKVTIQWRNGKLIADEPKTMGGEDTGPDPFTLLLSSLAACTLATLRMYIDRKGWNVPIIRVNLNMFQQVKDGRTVTTIDRDLHFETHLSDEIKEKLLQIAAHCPISVVLQNEVHVRNYIYNEDTASSPLLYEKDDLTVEWRPDICKHSGRCVNGLPNVFDTHKHPWINIEGASTADIMAQVEKCPTGALKYHKK